MGNFASYETIILKKISIFFTNICPRRKRRKWWVLKINLVMSKKVRNFVPDSK